MQLQQYNTKAKQHIQNLQLKLAELTKKKVQNTTANNLK